MLTWVEFGSLWIRELPDGRALKLTSAEGLHSPRFSPSRRWIEFEDRGDKRWLVRSDGQAGAPLDANAAAFLPREDLVLLRPDGIFAPDRQRYVFSRDLRNDSGPSVGQLCIASLAAPNREPEVRVSDQDGAKQPYAWTRDGKSIIYWNGDEWSASFWSDGVELYVVDVESGRSRALGAKTLANVDMLDLAPASAGNRLAVTDGAFRETWAGKRIALIDLDTNVSWRLMPDNVTSMCPAWSPDGRRIACFAGPDADLAFNTAMAGLNYTVIRPDGTKETKTFTPESHIGIGGGEEAHAALQQRKIWMLDPSNNNPPRQLTSDTHYRDEEPLWSADGNHILFARMDYEGNSSLWLMDASGVGAVQVCRLGPLHQDESWFGYYGSIDWHAFFDWQT